MDKKEPYMLIKLTRGLFAKVDPKNFHRLSKHKWFAIKSGTTFYAARNSKYKKGEKRHTIRMHNEIKKAPEGHELDHINLDGLDNRENNIRIVTHQQNVRNYRSRGGTSKYKGVGWHKRRKKWQAKICFDYKQIYLGFYDSEREAAIAYDNAAFEKCGVYAFLNFPERFTDKSMDAIL